MIPEDLEDLEVIAGEYVLGLLDAPQTLEIEESLGSNSRLRDMVAFWNEKLDPLCAFAGAADPPAGMWASIERRVMTDRAGRTRLWNSAPLWRWATAGLAAAAAALVIYIAVPSSSPTLVAGLHTPQAKAAEWIATLGPGGMRLVAVAGETPPEARSFELWAIAKQGARPRALGVIPAGGRLLLSAPPRELAPGTTLAISVEPKGGSPTGLPTGPIAFVGVLEAT